MKPDISRAKQLKGDAIVIGFFALMAFGIYSLGQSLANDIRALRTEGVPIQAQVLRVNGGKPPQVTIKYMIDGVERTAHEKTLYPPPPAGSWVQGLYNPNNPDRVRLRALDEDTIYEDMTPFRMLPIFLLIPLVVLVFARIAKLRNKDPFEAIGPLLGLILLAVVVGVNFLPDTQESIIKRFGTEVWAVSSHLWVSGMEVLILGPVLWMFGSSVMRLQGLSIASGRGIQRIGIIFWAWASPEARAKPRMRRQFLISSALLLALLILSIIALSLTD